MIREALLSIARAFLKFGTPQQWISTFGICTAIAFAGGYAGYLCAERTTEHDIAARYYAHCRENLGLFEPLTMLQNGHSACGALIEEELGIENRWEELR